MIITDGYSCIIFIEITQFLSKNSKILYSISYSSAICPEMNLLLIPFVLWTCEKGHRFLWNWRQLASRAKLQTLSQ